MRKSRTGGDPHSSPTIKAMLSPTQRALLWVALLVVAFAVGFALGVALWEGQSLANFA